MNTDFYISAYGREQKEKETAAKQTVHGSPLRLF